MSNVCSQDETISRARVIRDNAADFTVANAPREQAAIDLTNVDAADPTDDPDNDAEPAQLEKDRWQPSSSLPGAADQSSAAAAALAMDVDPDRMLHSFEIDSTQVRCTAMHSMGNSQTECASVVMLLPVCALRII